MEDDKLYFKSDADCSECITPTSNPDLDLSKKVYQTLQSDILINSKKIKVHVSGRTVYLEGMVESEKERNIAYEEVMNIFGVRNVVNYLTFPCPYANGNFVEKSLRKDKILMTN